MVECSPATRAARVRFPADANALFLSFHNITLLQEGHTADFYRRNGALLDLRMIRERDADASGLTDEAREMQREAEVDSNEMRRERGDSSMSEASQGSVATIDGDGGMIDVGDDEEPTNETK